LTGCWSGQSASVTAAVGRIGLLGLGVQVATDESHSK